ncbi:MULTISPECIES: hypothetical protein [Aeromonas]|uniref:hypothetical protein n=1 Tax=Aeromonas TaxID=642 RepID=UPI0003090586|nr:MULTISPECIES: hypothetical protein [Aeromonas]ELO1557374.1 hypothetical protein [Aeromonas hydrophila]MBL0603794.1 hypothetical protein [Aeromonas dhakensis]MBW3732480.1 hypothetical protein [Aeromonas dhakensis]MDD9223464.1 hypothetical protein [Aeromonas hydrophila]QSR57044.1 hypothetical protein GO601_17265 [Aeromonas dhakensis]
MKYLHANNINGLIVHYNNKLVLILVTPLEGQGTVQFDFIDPFTDQEVLDDDEARALLLELMEDNK